MNQMAVRMTGDAEREIARIERDLAMLKRHVLTPSGAPAFGSPASHVRAVLRARRAREELIGADLFADPAWDMLLDLYAAHLEQRKVSTSELCIASAVPATTALRWIEKLVQMKMVTREDDHLDGRRTWVALCPGARDKMESYFDAMAPSLRVV
jgi:DNA-binding MarR family transcriptional regulator